MNGSSGAPGAIGQEVASRLRRALGLRRTLVVEGVRYVEASAGDLQHALSRRGPGFKDYLVRFRDGQRMAIRACAEREFADLTGPRLLPEYAAAGDLPRPGSRVLIAAGGTGYAAKWAAGLVGPSGAVVSLERDAQSVAYAWRRYPAENISYEQGFIEALSGETDGSFDGAWAVDALRAGDDPPGVIRELARVVRPGGWVLVSAPSATEAEETRGGVLAFTQDALQHAAAEAIAGAGPARVEAPDAAMPGRASVLVVRGETG
jgi:SAM-dependent methyltransferase